MVVLSLINKKYLDSVSVVIAKLVQIFRVTFFAAFCTIFCASNVQAESKTLDLLPVNGYLLVDYASGDVLAEKNSTKRLEPASITKVMTAYIVYQALASGKINLTNKVVTSKNAYNKEGSKSFLQLKKPYSVEQLLKGMVIQSGNDAAISLAEKVAGSEAAFVHLMNEQAQRLGMKDTSFANVTGLPNPGHYTTAADLAILARAMIRDFPQHYKLYSERSYTLEGIVQENRNQLLRQTNLQNEDGQRILIDGMKTGHTNAAGYCLLASGRTEDMRLISIVLGAGSDVQRTNSSLELLKYGFNNFKSRELFPAEYFVSEVKVWKGDKNEVAVGTQNSVNAILPTKNLSDIKTNLVLATEMQAPIKKGQSMGSIEMIYKDKLILEIPLVALESVDQGGILSLLTDSLLQKFLGLFN
jgi:D-alanyl-D-alanine carboxypeptidase (penicillin-binding protein 5/6)